jgi:hypothetical protein
MDPNSGKLYSQDDMLKLTEDERSRLVQLEGRREDIERISAAVAGLNRAERRAAERAEKRAKR